MLQQKTELAIVIALITAIFTSPGPADAAMTPDGQMIVVPEYVQAEQAVKAGTFKAAIPYLNETLRKFPAHANAWNLMGYVHRRLGKFDEAEKYYDAALTINPNHTGALNYLGQLFIQTGRPDKAKALLGRLQEACSTGCEDLDHLQKAVTTGVAGNY